MPKTVVSHNIGSPSGTKWARIMDMELPMSNKAVTVHCPICTRMIGGGEFHEALAWPVGCTSHHISHSILGQSCLR